MSELTSKPNDFKIGLFVIGAAALLLTALCVFGATRFFEPKSVEETYVTGDVGGLKEGAPVLLRGVAVGEVTRIDFSWNLYGRSEPRYVVVQFELRRNVSLVPPGQAFARHLQEEVSRGLRARIKSQGLVGATVVSLEYLDPKEYPPVPVPWTPRRNYIPAAPGQFSQMLASLETTISHVQQLDLQGLAQSVQRDLDAVERVVNHVDQMNFAAFGTNANALLTELRAASTQLRSLIGVTNGQTGATIGDVAAQTKDLLDQLRQSGDRINRILANLDTASINHTVENAQRATRELDEVLRQLKTYPSGVLFGKPPPPARSVEQSRR
jgi:ABC-type transporter Mla subunit MlaD